MTIQLKAFWRLESLHYWVTATLALAAVPIAWKLGLPLQFDWIYISDLYWRDLAAQAIFAASILMVIGFPQDSVRPFLKRIRTQPLRLVLLVAFSGALWLATSWGKALILFVDTVAILEWYERGKPQSVREGARTIGLAALYLFGGLVLVSIYNMIIVSVRFFAEYDAAFYNLDLWLMHGVSVSAIVHQLGKIAPVWFFHLLDFIYLGMFAQIGACLILMSIIFGKRRGIQFVGTILIAYYITLGLFFLWPSHGPYLLCPDHFIHFPKTLFSYSAQQVEIAGAQAFWRHHPPVRPPFLYFIAFPCMHITQPLIVLWYLRKWKRMIFALVLYDVALTVSIIGLEWHYLVDLIGGIGVAALAILITDARELWFTSRQNSGLLSYDGELKRGSYA